MNESESGSLGNYLTSSIYSGRKEVEIDNIATLQTPDRTFKHGKFNIAGRCGYSVPYTHYSSEKYLKTVYEKLFDATGAAFVGPLPTTFAVLSPYRIPPSLGAGIAGQSQFPGVF